MVLMAILGGKGTLWGPVIGATLFHLFKEGGGLNESKRLDVPLLGQIPYSEELMLSIDKGEPLVFSNEKHPVSEIFNKIAKSLEE